MAAGAPSGAASPTTPAHRLGHSCGRGGRADLVPIEVPAAGPGEVTVKMLVTVISTGTERAYYLRLPNAQVNSRFARAIPAPAPCCPSDRTTRISSRATWWRCAASVTPRWRRCRPPPYSGSLRELRPKMPPWSSWESSLDRACAAPPSNPATRCASSGRASSAVWRSALPSPAAPAASPQWPVPGIARRCPGRRSHPFLGYRNRR